ncbi:MAG: AAA family ATPase [Chloroflexota bacterium]|nr:AAA family ATPase [Chloroflexota bacterium]
MDTSKKKPIIIALANQKGGVGKTTTAVNVAAELARLGLRVVLVDLDSQANATQALGIDPLAVPFTTYHLLVGDVPVADILIDTAYGLQLIPSHIDVAAAEGELDRKVNREQRLARRLSELPAGVDVVLIDCPPSLTLLTLNALTAAQWVLLPLQTEPFAVSGLAALLRTVELVQRETNPGLRLLGILFTLYDKDHAVARNIAEGITASFGPRVFTTAIPRYGQLAETAQGGPIRSYAPHHKAVPLFAAVAQEVRTRADF